MNIFIPIIILILVTLILGLLQLSPGLFALFYHYALGKNSRKKADDLSLDFILGTETFTAIVWFSIYAIFFTIFYHNPGLSSSFIPWIIAGILFIETFLVLLYYYQKGNSTALFIPRSTAKALTAKARRAHNRQDAFLLGFVSKIPELIFSLPLCLLITYILAYSTFIPSAITIIFFIIISTLQLFIIRTAYRTKHTLADIQRFRRKTKTLVRFILTISLFLLTFATIYIGISYNG